jgi:hypothetical protein
VDLERTVAPGCVASAVGYGSLLLLRHMAWRGKRLLFCRSLQSADGRNLSGCYSQVARCLANLAGRTSGVLADGEASHAAIPLRPGAWRVQFLDQAQVFDDSDRRS